MGADKTHGVPVSHSTQSTQAWDSKVVKIQSVYVAKMQKLGCTSKVPHTPPYLEPVWGYAAAVYVALVRLTVPLSLSQHLINTLQPQQRTYTQHSTTKHKKVSASICIVHTLQPQQGTYTQHDIAQHNENSGRTLYMQPWPIG
jgi:hypothetical protein